MYENFKRLVSVVLIGYILFGVSEAKGVKFKILEYKYGKWRWK